VVAWWFDERRKKVVGVGKERKRKLCVLGRDREKRGNWNQTVLLHFVLDLSVPRGICRCLVLSASSWGGQGGAMCVSKCGSKSTCSKDLRLVYE